MLLSASTNYDSQLSSSSRKISRKLFSTEADDAAFSSNVISKITEENVEYEIDISASTLLVNMTNQSSNTYTPKENYSSLSPEVREI